MSHLVTSSWAVAVIPHLRWHPESMSPQSHTSLLCGPAHLAGSDSSVPGGALLDAVYKVAHISPTHVVFLVSKLPLWASDPGKMFVLWAVATAMREAVLPFGLWWANRSPMAQMQGQQNHFCVSWKWIGHHVTETLHNVHCMGYGGWTETMNSEGNNTTRAPGSNEFLRLKCRNNGGKKVKNNGWGKDRFTVVPMEKKYNH